jgi:GMP synthase-like glutamine amidotransferase
MKYIKEYIDSISDGVILIIDNTKPPEKNYLSNVIKYLESRKIDYVICADIDTLKRNIENNKIIGSISTGSDYRVFKSEHLDLSYYAIENLKCPMLGICFGFQSMAKFYGSEISQDELLDDLVILDNYDSTHPLFSGIDLNTQPVKFCFHDFPIEVPPGFRPICEINNKIAGICSNNRFGLLFHPEDMIETYKIFDNFIQICKSSKVQESKIIKSFRLFESQNAGSGNASFNWLKKQNNEDYLKLSELLLDLFDDWSIRPKEEGFYFEDDPEEWPTYKFWTFHTIKSKSVVDDTADFSKISKDDEIQNIIIFNIPVVSMSDRNEDSFLDFKQSIEELKPRIRGYIGKELIMGHEEIRPEDPEDNMYYDVILRLVQLDKTNESLTKDNRSIFSKRR